MVDADEAGGVVVVEGPGELEALEVDGLDVRLLVLGDGLEGVDDDSHEEVEHDEGEQDLEGDEEHVAALAAAPHQPVRAVVVEAGHVEAHVHRRQSLRRVGLDEVPLLARGALEQREERAQERREVRVRVDALPVRLHVRVQVHPDHREHEQHYRQQSPDVRQRRQRDHQRLKLHAQALRVLHQPQDPEDPERPQHRRGCPERLEHSRHLQPHPQHRHHHHEAVEHVPVRVQVDLPHREHLQHCLHQKHAQEHHVRPEDYPLQLLRRPVKLHREHHRVQDYAHQDEVLEQGTTHELVASLLPLAHLLRVH